MQTISIIRERGQLTIPESIRRMASWAAPMSAVSVSILKPNEIVIRPHTQNIDWDKIWEGIKNSRELKGTGKVISGAEFLERDRKSH